MSTEQQDAYGMIKQLILEATLIPGQKVSKNGLVNRLGIGDTPVREAIILLKKEGLFQIVPQSGTFVSKISVQEIFEAKYVREAMEKLVVSEVIDCITPTEIQELEEQLAVQRFYFELGDQDMYFHLDEQFHQTFYKIAQKLYVWQWMTTINSAFNRCRYIRLSVKELKWQAILEQHEEMVHLLKIGDKEGLMALSEKHIGMIDTDMKIILKQFPDYFN